MHQDHLGSSVASTTAASAIAWREDFTPYGEKRLDPNANKDDEGFTGHIDDAATGLTYMQARYYDPVIGRFLSNDPVGFTEGGVDYFNRYAYTLNNPINGIDPDGKRCVAANGWSDYCRRASLYKRFDNSLRNRTRFFAAASMTSAFLANNDLPFAGNVLSNKTESFLGSVAKGLEKANANIASKIENGTIGLSGPALDKHLGCEPIL